MIAFIINRDRLGLPAKLADWLSFHGITPIFIDNASTYEPLLQFYYETSYEVYRIFKNVGSRVVWEQGLLDRLKITDKRYIVTDSDLDPTDVPDDFLDVLQEGLNRYPDRFKCGLGLRIDDLPDTDLAKQVKALEMHYWVNSLDDQYYNSQVDTTLALYERRTYNGTQDFLSACRTKPPYLIKHVPWYYKSWKDLPEDEQYYFSHAAAGHTYWCNQIKKQVV